MNILSSLLNKTVTELTNIDSSIMILPGLVIIVVITLSYIQKKQKQKKQDLINHTIGIDYLKEILGRKSITFPIIAFGKGFVEAAHIKTLEQYENEYLFDISMGNSSIGIDAAYIVEAKGGKYELQSKTLEEIGQTNPDIKQLKFQKLEDTGEIIPFSDLKNKIITTTKKLSTTKSGSVYENIIDKIEQTSTIEELVEIMDEGDY